MNEEEINNTPPTEAPEEPTKDEIAEAFTEPEPENPDLVAQAATETPAETAPAFPTEPEKAKKPKKALYALVACICLAVIGGSVWFLTRPKNSDNSTSVQHDIEPAPSLEPVEVSKLTLDALKGNSLSDFDLAFLRLENKQDNIIYSPLSIKYALAMLADGANSNSKAQITALIGDYAPKSYINSANRSLANAMFIKNSFQNNVLDSYTQNLSTKYNASVILDPLTSATNINSWVSEKTLNIIDHLLEDQQVADSRFVLVNALAIDMNWKNRIQCTFEDNSFPCLEYSVRYRHTNYYDGVGKYTSEAYDHAFGDQTYKYQNTLIGATSNHYDIMSDVGEAKIRETVQQAYEEWATKCETEGWTCDLAFDLDQYMSELGNAGYGDHLYSSDFSFLDTDTEKVFAKDLQEYDGATLQYVGIMPKSGSLNAYLNNLTAEKATSLISNLKDISDPNNFKDGIVTRLKGSLPLFKFSYSLNLNDDLKQLGITDIFDAGTADLSNLITKNEETEGIYITDTVHKADIDFSNDGIKAAAATAVIGGRGAAGPNYFEYEWELPVEEIDLTFDQPFLFLIRDKASGEIWFAGTVYNPSQS